MQFHQVLVSASAGDAITNMAFELDALLAGVGQTSIHALHRDSRLGDRVQSPEDLRRKGSVSSSDDVIIFHASIGEPRITNFVAQRPERLVIIYHNISPAEPFLPFDPSFAGLLASGRIELASLADKAELALAVSNYSAKELLDMGFANVAVAPLVVDIDELREVEPLASTMNHFENGIEGPVVLFVGQLLPHKRIDLLLKAYNILSTHLLPEANLVVIGTPRLASYHAFLNDYMRELNLYKGALFGSVSQAELVAAYRNADVLVTLSEHEGFCVPLVEAMGFDVPVIARDRAAIGETMAGAGVLLPADDDPLLAAEAMAEVLTNQPLKRALVARGRERIKDLDPDLARASLLNHILTVADR